mgnify:CR=1 FL=1
MASVSTLKELFLDEVKDLLNAERQLVPGLCADLALFDLRSLGFAGGAVHDPVGALLLCASAPSAYTVVNGQVVVRKGQLTTVDLGPLVEKHNRLAQTLAHGVHA